VVIAMRSCDSADDCLRRLQVRKTPAKSHGAAKAKFEGLHGYGAAKAWGIDLIADIAEFRAGRLAWEGAGNPTLLLSGPPGVGKTAFMTVLAKAAGLPLIATSVAAWHSAGHLGDTLKAMRKSFDQAFAKSPCVLFIDELDGISNRSRLQGEYVEYWSQIVNLLLIVPCQPGRSIYEAEPKKAASTLGESAAGQMNGPTPKVRCISPFGEHGASLGMMAAGGGLPHLHRCPDATAR
jgi:hypothetical protein